MSNQQTKKNQRLDKTVLYAQETQARMDAASNLKWEKDARSELDTMLASRRDGRERLGYVADLLRSKR